MADNQIYSIIQSPNHSIQIGVTGGIGSGKSVVCRIFEALGAPIYNADDRAKWLINHDEPLKIAIKNLLGEIAYLPDGSYNRVWVAAQVFNNAVLLQQLNALVHPLVFEDAAAWLRQHQNAPYVVRESALMKKGTGIDKIVVIHAPVATRIKRIKQRDPQRSEQEIRDIIARQMPDSERLAMADFVIYNDETQLLIPQVLRVFELISSQQSTVGSVVN